MEGDNAILQIILDGSLLTAGNGLEVAAGNTTVSGLVINSFPYPYDGIVLSSDNGNTISGNFIGTDASGTAVIGYMRYGINLHGSPNNRIRGD